VGGTLAGNLVNSTTGYQVGGNTVVNIGPNVTGLFLGVGAGVSTAVQGTGNVFAGYDAGYSNTSGARNVFTGYRAGFDNTIGTYNVFAGFQAGANNTTGFGNVFDGEDAGVFNTTGTSNVFVGQEAGIHVVAGSNNIDLGSNSGSNSDESNTIRIGNGQTAAYFAGINGQTTNAGMPVFIDSNGKLGTTGGTLTFTELTGNLPSSDFSGTYSNTVSLSSSGNSFNGNFNANSSYQIGGNSVLSAGNFASNAYVGVQAGLANTQGAGNAFVGQQAGANNNSNYNTFLGFQAGYNNTTGSSDIYVGNVGCTSPCTENNTIRIGNQGAGSNQQNATYIAGINGTTVSNASPVYVDSNGQVGTSSNRFQWEYSTYDVPAGEGSNVFAACPAGYPYLVSGSCGANTFNGAVFYTVVDYSGPYTGNGSSNNPSYQNNPNTWQCMVHNTDTSSHTIIYGALCSN
jgi:hypothetical protein